MELQKAATRTATSRSQCSKTVAVSFAALCSTTPAMSPRYARPSVSSRLCSLLKRLRRVSLNTSYHRRTREEEIQISMTMRVALTTKRMQRTRSASPTRKKADRPKSRVTTIGATITSIRELTDRGKNDSYLFLRSRRARKQLCRVRV